MKKGVDVVEAGACSWVQLRNCYPPVLRLLLGPDGFYCAKQWSVTSLTRRQIDE